MKGWVVQAEDINWGSVFVLIKKLDDERRTREKRSQEILIRTKESDIDSVHSWQFANGGFKDAGSCKEKGEMEKPKKLIGQINKNYPTVNIHDCCEHVSFEQMNETVFQRDKLVAKVENTSNEILRYY